MENPHKQLSQEKGKRVCWAEAQANQSQQVGVFPKIGAYTGSKAASPGARFPGCILDRICLASLQVRASGICQSILPLQAAGPSSPALSRLPPASRLAFLLSAPQRLHPHLATLLSAPQ